MSVAVDPATVFGPRSILCASPLLPNFEEMARNECKSQIQTSFSNHHGNKDVLSMKQGMKYNLTNQISRNIYYVAVC